MAKYAVKSTASRGAMKAREQVWLKCLEQGVSIWDVKMGPEEA